MNSKRNLGVAVVAAMIFSSHAAAQEPPFDETKAAVQQALDAAETQLFRTGARESDWNKHGVDVKAVIERKQGGLARNYLLATDNEGDVSVTIYSSAPVGHFVPASWKRVARIGNMDAAAQDAVLDFASLQGAYYIVTRITEKRIGDAYCTAEPLGADLYRDPSVQSEPDLPPIVAKLIFEGSVAMSEKYIVCGKYEAVGSGYRIRSFFEDGRSLPGMDEGNDRITIVPAGDIQTMLKGAAR